MAWLRAPGNALAFAVRRRLAWRRGPPRPVGERMDGLFDHLPRDERAAAWARERELRARYDLAALAACSSRLDYAENLCVLDALERIASWLDLGERVTALDVGSKNFCYAPGLARFLARAGAPPSPRRVELTGVEVDAHVVYRDLRSRLDWARAYVAAAGPGVRYLVGDVRDLDLAPCDVVTVFFPFVTRYALLAWGLPLRLFAPRAVLARALELVVPSGRLVVLSQTPHEREVLLEMLRELGAAVLASEPAPCALVRHHRATEGRFVTVAAPDSARDLHP